MSSVTSDYRPNETSREEKGRGANRKSRRRLPPPLKHQKEEAITKNKSEKKYLRLTSGIPRRGDESFT